MRSGREGGRDSVEFRSRDIGLLLELDEPMTLDKLLGRVTAACEREPLVFISEPQDVRRVAILSGGGANYLADAIVAGADVYITGEPTEHVMAEAAEGGIHFVAAGHHATERRGVCALGQHLKERFGVATSSSTSSIRSDEPGRHYPSPPDSGLPL
jgi:putative NIF3 family GTP cyclohydrolase 1 type 2